MIAGDDGFRATLGRALDPDLRPTTSGRDAPL